MRQELQPREQLAAGEMLRRAVLDILGEARRALEEPARTNAARIHDFRKAMKRLRAVLRLLSPVLGEEVTELRMQSRDLARELGGPRDAQSALDAMRDLAKHGTEPSLSDRSFKSVTNRLAALKKSSERIQLTAETKERFIEWIDSTGTRVRAWPLDATTFDTLADGLATHYRRARRAMPEKWSLASFEEVHEFRQRVIVHRYQLDLIEPLNPRAVRKWVATAQRLRARLGRYQDLTLLIRLSTPGQPLAPWRGRIASMVKQRQDTHIEASVRLASRIFKSVPKALRKRIATLAD